ncbi:MAG: multiheme c-type cytochrome [Roseibacillus sp.]|nr:multiheme c-type cytochrome [Roseibacillus sp.]
MITLLRNRIAEFRSDRKRLIVPSLVGLWVLSGLVHFLVSSCSSSGNTALAPPPHIEGATFVGSQSCATCHVEISKVFPGSVHSRISFAGNDAATDRSCESCHGPGSKHVASGGGTQFERQIVNPGKTAESCLKCHVTTSAEFQLPHHHPVLEKQMNCVDCHDPHGHDIGRPHGHLAVGRQDASCSKCHQEQTRNFVFEHEAMQEGCTTCHQPHGSVNRKMLAQPDSNLCLKCHAQVPGGSGGITIGKTDHSSFLNRGSCFSCHTAVHGSNIHPKLLY